MLDTISQIIISVLGLLAIFLVAKKNRWGFVVGLLAQPAWFYTTYVHGQWLILLLSVAYTISWGYGIYQWFFKKTAA